MPIGNDPTSRGDFQTETGFHRVITRYEEKLIRILNGFLVLVSGRIRSFLKLMSYF